MNYSFIFTIIISRDIFAPSIKSNPFDFPIKLNIMAIGNKLLFFLSFSVIDSLDNIITGNHTHPISKL